MITNLVVTAYCACGLCCGKTDAITASGVRVQAGRTVAANQFPFGTRLRIEGMGWRRVEDRLSRRYTGRVDVYMRNHRAALRFGKRRLSVEVP